MTVTLPVAALTVSLATGAAGPEGTSNHRGRIIVAAWQTRRHDHIELIDPRIADNSGESDGGREDPIFAKTPAATGYALVGTTPGTNAGEVAPKPVPYKMMVSPGLAGEVELGSPGKSPTRPTMEPSLC